MKEIRTKSFGKLSSDLITHPPIPGEEDGSKSYTKRKKKKKLYQLNREVEDLGLEDFVE